MLSGEGSQHAARVTVEFGGEIVSRELLDVSGGCWYLSSPGERDWDSNSVGTVDVALASSYGLTIGVWFNDYPVAWLIG